ncbi:14-3-3 protein homolog [Pistacia vera]|uniref:14-3-3 protein homolog n=1 Tax=Pistacia vera TaxID=55513 RepID=UPI001262E463|nr:14-3-3 protein homolog [Pistacia vera]
MGTLTRDQYVYMAKLSEQAERYEETVNFIESLVSRDFLCFSNHLSVAYKNVIGSHRAAWQIISSIDLNEESHRTMTTWRWLKSIGRSWRMSYPRKLVTWENRGSYLVSQHADILPAYAFISRDELLAGSFHLSESVDFDSSNYGMACYRLCCS